ncbi:MAG: hypothetical protein AAGG07_14275 [Planctomycetota bacterium]
MPEVSFKLARGQAEYCEADELRQGGPDVHPLSGLVDGPRPLHVIAHGVSDAGHGSILGRAVRRVRRGALVRRSDREIKPDLTTLSESDQMLSDPEVISPGVEAVASGL